MLRPRLLAAAIAVAALAGCSSPEAAGPPGEGAVQATGGDAPGGDATGGQARTSRGGEDRVRAVLYQGTRDLRPDADPEDAAFEVPAGARAMEAFVYANATGASPCWAGWGDVPPREGALAPNPSIDFAAPSGAQSVGSSVTGGCPGFGTSYRSEGRLDAEPGAWTVHHAWRGHGIRLEVIVVAEVPDAGAGAAAVTA